MEALLEHAARSPSGLAVGVVFLAAFLEYAAPVLPGDTVVLAGGLFVLSGAVPFSVMYGAAVLGGMLGALLQYKVGALCRDASGRFRPPPLLERLVNGASASRFLGALDKYGLWVVVLNRVFPGVRGVTFFVAGAARLDFLRVMLCGLVSQLGWTLLLLGIGVTAGRNFENIEATFIVYRRGLFAAGGAVVVLFLAAKLWQRLTRA